MKFYVATAILALYTVTGVGIFTMTEFDSELSTFVSLLLYVFIPAYGTYGTWFKSRIAILITLIFFVSQCVRNVEMGGLIPHLAPISVSLPMGDFGNGEGYLIDFFAISMVLFLGWLLKTLAFTNTLAHKSS